MTDRDFFGDLKEDNNQDPFRKDDNFGFHGGEPQERSFPVIGIVIGLVVGVIIAVVAVRYFMKKESAVDQQNIPIIRNESGDVLKVQPENPGGMQVPNQDKAVYKLGNSFDQQASQMMPENGKQAQGNEPTIAAKPLPSAQGVGTAPVVTVSRTAVETPSKVSHKPAVKTKQAKAAMPKKVVQKAAPKTSIKAQSTSVTSSSSAGGNWQVQLAALQTPEAAEYAWRDLNRKYPSLIAGKQHIVIKADLGSRGTFYRLRVDGLSKQAADDLCAALKAKGENCMVYKK